MISTGTLLTSNTCGRVMRRTFGITILQEKYGDRVVAKQTPGLEWDTLGAPFFPGKYGSPSGEPFFLKLLEGNSAGLLGLPLFSVTTGNS